MHQTANTLVGAGLGEHGHRPAVDGVEIVARTVLKCARAVYDRVGAFDQGSPVGSRGETKIDPDPVHTGKSSLGGPDASARADNDMAFSAQPGGHISAQQSIGPNDHDAHALPPASAT